MINLYLLCADLKNRQSKFQQKSTIIIAGIYSCLNNPSKKTMDMIAGWKSDFCYIYGDIATNLSSNSKLNRERLFARYGMKAAFENDEKKDEKRDEIESLLLLFFSIQTYFSLLVKYIMKGVLQGIRNADTFPDKEFLSDEFSDDQFSCEEIILGDFARQYGIMNYCYPDWYCWPLFELDNGFRSIMESIRSNVGIYQQPASVSDFQMNNNYDFIKQIYEAIIPKELRHALGEYYTPDWLAESTLKSAINAYAPEDINALSVIDPTCGSGTFLFKAILLKKRNGSGLSDILATVHGIDINPLAVLTAKTNYLLAVLDLLDGTGAITIPVFNADVVTLSNSVEVESAVDFLGVQNPSEAVRDRISRDRIAVRNLKKADVIIGNPPWVNWEYMPEQYRRSSQHLWLDYDLFSAKGRDLSFSKEDISVLITYIVIDKLLKKGGVIGFVIRQGVFKSAQNGVGFRKFKDPDGGIKVIKVEDLSRIRAFENASNSTALFFARKGEDNVYPVPYYIWEKREDIKKCSFDAYSQLQEVMSQITVVEQCAMPAVRDDMTSGWITAERDRLDSMKKVLGTNVYRARTGVFTGGANAVYWLRINHSEGDGISVTNIVERAKRKSGQITAELEKTFIFPMLRGSNVGRWKISYDTYLLCPHTAETRMWPVPQEELAVIAPRTLEYLRHFKEDLDGRNGFAGWEKEIQQQEFHAILRIGDYTFSKYKVIWRYIASEFICAVIGSVDDQFLGTKTILPNEKIMYVSTNNEKEAYYLCGILSSTLVVECVKGYMNPTSISAHVLNKLNIPEFDENDPIHEEIAHLCKEGHGRNDISPFIKKIDDLVLLLYGE